MDLIFFIQPKIVSEVLSSIFSYQGILLVPFQNSSSLDSREQIEGQLRAVAGNVSGETGGWRLDLALL